jgi:hypothetical protein
MVYQYNETNVMHFSFNLLRIEGFLHVSSITCSSSEGPPQTALGILRAYNVSLQSGHSQLTLYARNIPSAVCVASPEDEQVMLETCKRPSILNKLNEKCITLISLY